MSCTAERAFTWYPNLGIIYAYGTVLHPYIYMYFSKGSMSLLKQKVHLLSNMSHLVKVVCILSLVAMSATMAAPSCSSVTADATPCLSYIQGGGTPSAACCQGVLAVASMAKTKEDRVAICSCLKSILKLVGSYDPQRLPSLPHTCGASVELPPIDKNYDCSKVTFGGLF